MRRSSKILLAFVGGLAATAVTFRLRYGQTTPICDEAFYATRPSEAPAWDLTPWERVLARFVDSEGRVDYAGLAADPEDLDRFVATLAWMDAASAEDWSSQQRLAFAIDAFNACLLRAVTRNWPIEADPVLAFAFPADSILQIHRLKIYRREQVVVLGRRVTLEELEDEWIWDEHRDPRALLALHRGTLGGPPLASLPYSGPDAEIDARLEQQARRYLASERGTRWDDKTGLLEFSRIVEWNEERLLAIYGGKLETIPGFRDAGAARLEFLRRYGPEAVARALEKGAARPRALRYDWRFDHAQPAPE